MKEELIHSFFRMGPLAGFALIGQLLLALAAVEMLVEEWWRTLGDDEKVYHVSFALAAIFVTLMSILSK